MISNTDSLLRPRLPLWLPLAFVVTAGLAVFSIAHRHRIEQLNRAVGIAADWDTVEAFSLTQGISASDGLRFLKRKGLTAVVLAEESLGQLMSNGEISADDLEGSVETDQRLARGLRNRFAKIKGFKDSFSRELVRSVSVGLDPVAAKTVNDQDLQIIGRFSNPNGASARTVQETIKWAKELGTDIFLPQGDQVLGRRDAIKALEDSLKENAILYSTPEFAKIAGDANVVADAPEIVVRLHSAQTQELDKMAEAAAIERYAKAARERNQRLLLVRPLSPAADQPLDNFGDFVEKIAEELKSEGSTLKNPHPFEDSAVPAWLFALLGLSVVPNAYWAASIFVKSRAVRAIGLLLLLVLGAACYKEVARPYMALLAAMTFPITAFLVLDRKHLRWLPLEYILVSAISLIGGLVVAGLLNNIDYFVHAKQFEGVKAAVFLPVFIIGGYFLVRLMPYKEALDSPIKWAQAILTIIGLGVFAFLFMRTGNENPAAVSGLELRFRDILDSVLYVRPRTKEFMLGHPALIVGIGALMLWRKGHANIQPGWIAALLVVAAIGQTSIVNTLCHIHTPVQLSLARIAVGLVIGGIIGAILWLPVKSWLVRSR